MKICFVSPCFPTINAISQFNHDLIKYLRIVDPNLRFIGVAVNDGDEMINDYSSNIGFQIRKNVKEDYIAASQYINSVDCDVVYIQHEFSLFGGYGGKFANELVSRIKKPIYCIGHIIPIRNDARKPITKKKFFIRNSKYVKKYIVLIPEAKEKMISWGIKSNKIEVILHGAPDILFKSVRTSKALIRKRLDMNARGCVILCFGYVNHTKGIEYAIKAMRLVKKNRVDAKLYIIGFASSGIGNKRYELKLEKLIAKYDLHSYVKWKKEYVDNELLREYMAASDVGILPYSYRSYSSSGVLTFMAAAKLPVIVTRFSYAVALLQDFAYFVPFANYKEIYLAIREVMEDKDKYGMIVKNLENIRKQIVWRNVAKNYYNLIWNNH